MDDSHHRAERMGAIQREEAAPLASAFPEHNLAEVNKADIVREAHCGIAASRCFAAGNGEVDVANVKADG